MSNDTFCCACGHEHLRNARTHAVGPCPVCHDQCPGFKSVKSRTSKKQRKRADVNDGLDGLLKAAEDMTRLAAGIIVEITKIRERGYRAPTTRNTDVEPNAVLAAIPKEPPVKRRRTRLLDDHPVDAHANGASNGVTASSTPHHTPMGQLIQLSKGAKAVRIAIAQDDPKAVTIHRLQRLTGYAPNSIYTFVSELRGFAHVDDDVMVLTQAGRAAVGEHEPRPTPRGLVKIVEQRLSGGELKLFKLATESKKQTEFSIERLQEITKYAPNSLYTFLSGLKSAAIFEKSGRVYRAHSDFFK